jgi:hypothetical protein
MLCASSMSYNWCVMSSRNEMQTLTGSVSGWIMLRPSSPSVGEFSPS